MTEAAAQKAIAIFKEREKKNREQSSWAPVSLGYALQKIAPNRVRLIKTN